MFDLEVDGRPVSAEPLHQVATEHSALSAAERHGMKLLECLTIK
jgi:hypothetical protein